VQVDPIKPPLEAPGTVRLKLTYGRLLSSFAFKLCFQALLSSFAFKLCFLVFNLCCQALLSSFAFKLCFQALLSSFTFKFNLRRHSKGWFDNLYVDETVRVARDSRVGQCRLTVSNSALKPPMVSVLETVMLLTGFRLCFQILLAPLQPGRHARGGAGRRVMSQSDHWISEERCG